MMTSALGATCWLL